MGKRKRVLEAAAANNSDDEQNEPDTTDTQDIPRFSDDQVVKRVSYMVIKSNNIKVLTLCLYTG